MLYLIGLGLYDEEDISLRGVKAAKNSDVVYIETYTSPWRGRIEKLEELIGRPIVHLQRSDLEENLPDIIKEAGEKTVAVLVPGDPLVATTHSSVLLEARKSGLETRVIHSSSIISAIAETGLQIYKFGRVATVVYPEKNFFPHTPYLILKQNLSISAHTLLLLDVKDRERYMTVPEAIDLLLEIESEEKAGIFTPETNCIGLARLGSNPAIKYAPASELRRADLGPPPHSLIVPAALHFAEEEYIRVNR